MEKKLQNKIEKIQGEKLSEIYINGEINNRIYINEVRLVFGKYAIIYTGLPNTDEVLFEIYPHAENNQFNEILTKTVGRHLEKWIGTKLGWIWECKNDRGYTDLYILSFDDIIPNIGIFGLGSSIEFIELNMITLL
jgi:hypothetical protein